MSENVLELNDQNFDEVIQSAEPVFVDFWASWCAPCKVVAPYVEALAQEYKGKVKVAKLDVDANQDTAAKCGIRAMPTFLLFKDGKPVEQIVGQVSKSALEEMIKKHL